MRVDLTHVSPPARRVAEQYLERVAESLCAVDPALAAETVDSLAAHVASELDAGSSEEDALRVVEALGAPDEFAAELCAAARSSETLRTSGSVLGMPFDVGLPSIEKAAARWWNPADRRLFVPRLFGIGWDLNFGALAVYLHLIEPDAEDEPFSLVSDRAFLVAALVPVALTAAVLGSYLALRGALPAELPSHWDIQGRPDEYWPARTAFMVPFLFGLVPTVWAVWTNAMRRPALSRAVTIGFASMFSSLGVAIWLLTLLTVFGDVAAWTPPTLILGSFVVPMAVLTGLARRGRRGEIEHDRARAVRSQEADEARFDERRGQ